jgi:DNA-binding response OmpR family regulator
MTKSTTICLIDDEATFREVIRRYLEHEGYKVLEAESGSEALKLLQKEPVDLILLDIMLPLLDGFTLMRMLNHSAEYRAVNDNIPVIMLTSRSEEADRVVGFDLGVDDYVVKPFVMRELMARIKAVLRRAQGPSADTAIKPLVYGPLHIDALGRTVKIGALTPPFKVREFDLLWLLASHPQQIFTRDQLLQKIWGRDFSGEDGTVTVHIRRIREKIEEDASNPHYIQTVWGVGYKFEP